MALQLKTVNGAGVHLPVGGGDLVEFTPADMEGQEGAPVYLLRVPTYRLIASMEAAQARAGLYYPSDGELVAEMRRGIRARVEDDQQAEPLGILDEYAATLGAPAGPDDADDRARLAEMIADMEQQLAPVWPPLAELHARRAYALPMLLYLAAQHHLAGWRNVDVVYRASNGVVPDAVMERLPLAHIRVIGGRALSLRSGSRQALGNSASPSPSPPTPEAIGSV